MNISDNNTTFLTVAAWPNWHEKIDVFLRSAKKQGLEIELLDCGEKWQGYYHHKIRRLHDRLTGWQKERPYLKYVVFTDARDVVFIKNRREIFSLLVDADDEKVLFALDNKLRTWPFTRIWFAHRIALKFGNDGILNSGCYVGRIDRVLELLSECKRLHEVLCTGKVKPATIEGMLHAEIRPEHLNSDQFHLHAVQALWSDLIAVDVERRVFACFKGGFPLIKTAPELGSNGEMPLGTAGILHSPWMLHRDEKVPEAKDAWRHWALNEGIIEEY